MTAEKACVAPYGVQWFSTGCTTTTGPLVVLQVSPGQPSVVADGFFSGCICRSFCFVGGSHFTTPIKLHVTAVNWAKVKVNP